MKTVEVFDRLAFTHAAKRVRAQLSDKRTQRPQERELVEAERVPIGFRVTPELKKRVEEAARKTGRSQSGEMEFRLQQSFLKEDILHVVRQAVKDTLSDLFKQNL